VTATLGYELSQCASNVVAANGPIVVAADIDLLTTGQEVTAAAQVAATGSHSPALPPDAISALTSTL